MELPTVVRYAADERRPVFYRYSRRNLSQGFLPNKIRQFFAFFVKQIMKESGLTSRILTCTVLKGHWRCLF